jgi:integrase
VLRGGERAGGGPGRIADRADGIVFDDENMTVEEYLEGWLKGSVRSSVRDSTYDCYKIICRKHITSVLGGLKLSKLTAMHVQHFYHDWLDMRLAPVTVHKCHTVPHKALKQAVDWSLVPRNVADAVKAPRPAPRKKMHPPSPELSGMGGEAADAMGETLG